MKVQQILNCRVADNGNAIIDGINYGGVVVTVQAVRLRDGSIQANCINRNGKMWHLTVRGNWTKTYNIRGRRQ